MKILSTALGCLATAMVAAPLAAEAVSTAGPTPGIEEWSSVLRSQDASVEQREAALTALRAIAGGLPGEPATREATFALADFWLDHDGSLSDRRAVQVLVSATMLFADDPRTPGLLLGLAAAQLEGGEPLAAHASFNQLIDQGLTDDPAVLVRAARNALHVQDMPSAFTWSQRVDAAALDAETRPALFATRLRSAEALGRHDVALAGARELLAQHREALRLDPPALLAAARTFEEVGLLQDAVSHFEAFANLHPGAPEHPAALLALGRIQTRMGRHSVAEGFLDWLVEKHPESAAAHEARLERLELHGGPVDPEQIPSYLEAIRACAGTPQTWRTCERFTQRFVSAGFPMEAAAALLDVTEGTDGTAALGARECLEQTLPPALALLASREDDLSIVLLGLRAEARSVPLSEQASSTVGRARARLGLGASAAPPSPVEALRREADALWREGRDEEALARLGEALRLATDAGPTRAVRVLRADILFSSGERVEACTEYRRAAELGGSRWVALQLARCDGPEGQGGTS